MSVRHVIHSRAVSLFSRGANGKPVLMRSLVATASAFLIAATAVSANAAVTPASAGSSQAVSARAVLPPAVATPALATPAVATPAVATPASSPPAFTWPFSPPPVVRRRFEPPSTQWSRGHRGADLLAAVGQPVLSAGAGVVAFSGVIAGRGVITVRHRGGLRTTYEPVDHRLSSGAAVLRGGRIGLVSATAGHCAPLTCLHWGAISGRTYRDPLSLLGFGRPILLPLS